ncbi:MAG: hypothetical protein K6T91_01935 [Firmicutes bacterium]|nr:hypothetical protein [Bacillota bacterium]
MDKKSSRVDFWLTLVLVIAIILGAGLFIGLQTDISPGLTNLVTSPFIYLPTSIILVALISWAFTRSVMRRKLAREQKEIAKKTIRKTFEILRVTSRTLDNIDLKAGAILTGGTSPHLDRALAHEFMQNVRNQVVEIYNSLSICIEDWEDILAEEFAEIERRERQIEKVGIEQAKKAKKLKELERDPFERDKEVAAVKADLLRLAEKKRMYQAELLSEAKRLVGAPITKTTDIAKPVPAHASFEQLIKPPVYLDDFETDEVPAKRIQKL